MVNKVLESIFKGLNWRFTKVIAAKLHPKTENFLSNFYEEKTPEKAQDPFSINMISGFTILIVFFTINCIH